MCALPLTHRFVACLLYMCCVWCAAVQYDHTLLWRARLSSKDAAAVGVDLVNSSLYMQDVGRFMFTYPISSGDLVWTVGCGGEQQAVGAGANGHC